MASMNIRLYFLLMFYNPTTAQGGIMENQADVKIEGNGKMVPELLKRIQDLENNAVVSNNYKKYVDNKLDEVLEDRIVLRSENYKLKEQLKTQTRTQTNSENEEECLACSA